MKESLEKTISEELTPFKKKLAKSLCEFFGAVGIMGIELWRTSLVPSSATLFNPKYNPNHHPILNRDDNPFLYDTLQNMGDLWEGYTIPFFTNNLLRYTLPKLSENLRLGISLALSDAFIIAVESGVIIKSQQPDYGDIPAAFIGNLLYIGMNYIARNSKYNILYDMFKEDRV